MGKLWQIAPDLPNLPKFSPTTILHYTVYGECIHSKHIEYIYATVLAKTCIVRTKPNSILLSQLTDTLNIYPSPVSVSSVKC